MPAKPPPPPEPKSGGIAVSSDVDPISGTYVCAVHVTDDVSFVLDRSRVGPYVEQVFRVCAQAGHDAAVIRQLHEELGVELPVAAKVVSDDLRPDRPPTDHAATHPLEFHAGVSMNPKTGALRGHVVMTLTGKEEEELGRFGLTSTRRHAESVLEVGMGVDLDTGYWKALRCLFELEDNIARAVVNDLARFHEDWTLPDPEAPDES